MFIVPIPRDAGYLNMVWQAQGNQIVFTTVESFQNGNTGNVDFGFVLFDDLLGSHDIILLHGELQTGLLNKEEAIKIVRFVRDAYTDPSRFEWVKNFNHKPHE